MAEQVRLLIDMVSKSIEELPDYQGDPRSDTLLQVALDQHDHKFPDGTPHLGQLMRVEKKHWDSPSTKQAILNQIRESSGHTGLDTEFYEAKNQFQLDALDCFEKHRRNPACGDYKNDSKVLLPGTKGQRRALGIPESTVKTYLCNFCPVQSLVQSAHFDKTIS